MKSIFVCLLVCLARFCEGGALKEKSEVGTQYGIRQLDAPIKNDSGEANQINLEIKYMLKFTTICKPNNEFMKDCNPCKCAADGLSFTCTRNECMEVDKEVDKEVEVFMESEGADHIERHSVCRARETFNISCNSCRCNALGTDYACTNKLCPLPPDVEVFSRQITRSANGTKAQVCVANRMFVLDCNTCWCNEDGTSYVCTRRTCVPLLPDEEPDLGGIPAEDLRVTEKKCRPDEVFELDCNTCRCNPDGKSYSCTRRACEDPDDKQKVTLSRKARALASEGPKACQPDQEFRLDCNTCLCDNTGHDFSCTRNDCNNKDARRKREVSKDAECAQLKSFLQCTGDSVCDCPENGPCTMTKCTVENAGKSEELRATDTDPDFRCKPGDQFQQDCNDCTCAADGKDVYCTVRMCGDAVDPSS